MTETGEATTAVARIRRRFLWLPILDRYVLREFMIPFTVLIIGFILLFLVGDVFNDLADFLQRDTPLAITTHYFLLKLPGNIRFVLPISLLLACMYTMHKFGRSQEIIAMRACGLSLQRCSAAIYAVALLVTAINFWFNEKFVPDTEREAFLLRTRVKREDHQQYLHAMLTYRSPDGRRMWLFTYFDAAGEQKDVILKHAREDGSLAWDLRAARAEHRPGEGWVFRDAAYTEFDAEGLLPEKAVRAPELTRTVAELPETPRDIENSVKPVDDLSSWVILDLLRRTRDMAPKCRSLYRTTLYHRLAFPWACLVAVLLGIPLAGHSHRGGFFLSALSAVGLIIAYIFLSNLCRVFGNQGHLPPFIAGAGPTIAFIVYGWWNIARRD